MSKYIDREALLAELQEEIDFETSMYTEEQNKYFTMGLRCAYRDVKSQPTADVVEVTRCKDCFYAEEMEGIIGGTCLYCTHWCKDVDGDTFCSNGFSTTNKENKQ